MQKPLLKNLENEIDTLLDHVKTDQFSREILQTQIMNVLTDAYNALNKLDECRIENEHLGKFENDRTSAQKYINHYQKQFDQAKENEDENLKFRYGFSLGTYESFLKNPEKALSQLRLVIASNTLYEIDPDVRVYENFLARHDPKVLFNTQRNYTNKDLFLNLYKRLEGYQITHNKIIKSAGLKIFNFFNLLTKVQKTKLATHVQYLFASLGEDLSLNPKHAGSVKIIGEFEGFVLFDYQSNKKGDLYDFGMEEAFGQILMQLVSMLKKQGNLAMVKRINNNRKMLEVGLLAHLLT
jgi:hypothetical protein